MPNEALRRALDARRMSPGELASRLGVDPKTVLRWLTNSGRVPHARTRWAVAQELEVDEVVLWPRAVRLTVKTGADREIEGSYPTRAAMPPGVWRRLVGEAQHELVLCGFTSYFLWLAVPDLSALLRAKAAGGVRIRFVLGDPASANTRRGEQLESTPLSTSMRIAHAQRELDPLRDVVEVRQSDLGWGRSVWRGDCQAVVSWNVLGTLGHESPVLHLRRRQDAGLFDQIAVRHTEALWAAARPM